MKYAWIADHQNQFSAAKLCQVLAVSRCGYQQWRTRPKSERAITNQALTAYIKQLHVEYRHTYGRRRMRHALLAEGLLASEQRIARLMKLHQLHAHIRRRWRPRSSAGQAQGLANTLAHTTVTQANQAWVTDMTYLKTQQGWLYLATVMDAYTRQIIGWAMGQRMTTALIEQAFLMAMKQRQPTTPVVVHSDQGSQYMSQAYQSLLKPLNCIPSVSKRGHCYDNAMMESFFHSLKVESLYRYPVLPVEQTKSLIFNYIEGFYNPKRTHSALNYLSPNDFDKLHLPT